MRIHAISDLHVDFKDNGEWVAQISREDYRDDVLLVAGDIAHQRALLARALDELRSRFARVFFVPGNHDVWVRGETGDSLQKLDALRALCEGCGVEMEWAQIGSVRIVPLMSWYRSEFDPRAAALQEDVRMAWGDFRFCRWPEGTGALDDYFSALNAALGPGEGVTISFSHFLPRWELLPDRDFLRFKNLPRVAGSPLIEKQLRALGSSVHVFGHSHIPCDIELDGVRYVQHPLAYPRERRGRMVRLKQVV